MSASRDPQAGFTLLEVLISLTIIGLIFAGLAGYAQFAAHAYESVQSRSRLSPDEAGLAVTAGMLRDARDIYGTGARLAFVAPMPQALDVPALYLIDLRAGTDGGLTLSSRPRTLDPRDAAEGNLDRLALVPEATRIEFFYYDGATRLAAWTRPEGEPSLVEIVATRGDGDAQVLRVAPRFGRM